MTLEQIILSVFYGLGLFGGIQYGRWDQRRDDRLKYNWSCPHTDCGVKLAASHKVGFELLVETHLEKHKDTTL